MMNQDPEYLKEVLFTQTRSIETGLLAANKDNGLIEQLETGTRYKGIGTGELFLSFLPTLDG